MLFVLILHGACILLRLCRVAPLLVCIPATHSITHIPTHMHIRRHRRNHTHTHTHDHTLYHAHDHGPNHIRRTIIIM